MRATILILLPALLLACGGGGGGGDNVDWEATFTGGESSGTGGSIIQITGSGKAAFEWTLLEPEPASDLAELPPVEDFLVAEAETLLLPGTLVRDAIQSPHGLLALAETPDGTVRLAAPEAGAEVEVPYEVHRLVLVSLDPLEVLLVGAVECVPALLLPATSR